VFEQRATLPEAKTYEDKNEGTEGKYIDPQDLLDLENIIKKLKERINDLENDKKQ
jgi:hypothetical protein